MGSISDLPSSIIDCILDRLPICDAVATSVLSKEWRHKWRTIGNLVLDQEFTDRAIRRKNPIHSATMNHEYISIISSILFLHLGPIRKFVLHIPDSGDTLPSNLLNSWMFFISQNNVKELTIQAKHARIRLPSFVFHCSELQYLKVSVDTLDLHPPQDFEGFHNLLSLDLCCVLDGTQISNLISKCPLLERLIINCNARGQTLVIDAPRLLSLSLSARSMGKLLKPKNIHSVTAITLQSLGRIELCDLVWFVGSAPNVVTFTVRRLLKITGIRRDAPTSLPTSLHNLKILNCLEIDISSPLCLNFIFCLLKSSPNLQELNLSIYPPKNNEEAALHFLDMQRREPHTLNSLSVVNIKRLKASKVELMFIQWILSCSPVLKSLHLLGDRIFNEGEFTFLSELLKCKPLSSQAQVIDSRPRWDISRYKF